MDENLSWVPHINALCDKTSKMVGIINRLKFFVPANVLKLMYNTLILPHISYGILSWGHVNTNRLLLLQKRVVRILCRANYSAHTSALFARENILKITDIFNLNVGKLMYNHAYSTVPIDISIQF